MKQIQQYVRFDSLLASILGMKVEHFYTFTGCGEANIAVLLQEYLDGSTLYKRLVHPITGNSEAEQHLEGLRISIFSRLLFPSQMVRVYVYFPFHCVHDILYMAILAMQHQLWQVV